MVVVSGRDPVDPLPRISHRGSQALGTLLHHLQVLRFGSGFGHRLPIEELIRPEDPENVGVRSLCAPEQPSRDLTRRVDGAPPDRQDDHPTLRARTTGDHHLGRRFHRAGARLGLPCQEPVVPAIIQLAVRQRTEKGSRRIASRSQDGRIPRARSHRRGVCRGTNGALLRPVAAVGRMEMPNTTTQEHGLQEKKTYGGPPTDQHALRFRPIRRAIPSDAGPSLG